MKIKMKRIDIKKIFVDDNRVNFHNTQRYVLAKGINEIMDYLEELSKKIDKIDKIEKMVKNDE